MTTKPKGTCAVCGKSPRVLTAIDSGQEVCTTCLKELRPPRPKHLATLNQIERAKSLGFDIPDDITRDECKSLIDEYYRRKGVAERVESLQRQLAVHGITINDWASEQARLRKQFAAEPSVADVAWGCYNLASLRTRGNRARSALYWEMALFLHREGRRCFDMRRRSAIAELKAMQEESKGLGDDFARGVEVTGSCTASERLEGRVFSFDEAINNPPIPCKDCDRDGDPSECESWCACGFNLALRD